MEPRLGRLYMRAVLRPLAEQVVGVLGVQPGETACDLICDGATMGSALGATVGNRGTVVLIDTDPALLQGAEHDVAATGCIVSTRVAIGAVHPLAEWSCDRVASLCTLGFWDGDMLYDVAERVTRPTGCAAIVTWDAARPPLHEVALIEALRDVGGIRSTFLERCLASTGSAPAAGWERETLQDVVRFDGIGSYWAAMVVSRPVATELAEQPEDVLTAVRSACQRALEPCTAADGTMRIPVRATLYRLGSGTRG
ncbi:MAG TPA: hypothetical protein VI296_02075 [Candidatus Dormibacteraeota bacterium]